MRAAQSFRKAGEQGRQSRQGSINGSGSSTPAVYADTDDSEGYQTAEDEDSPKRTGKKTDDL